MRKPAILSSITGDAARARATDPTTSHAAADSISAQALEDREREVLDILGGATRPLCAQEIEAAHDSRVCTIPNHQQYSHSGIRTAMKQLADAGVIERAGTTRTRTKRDADTWRIPTVAAATLRARIDNAIQLRLTRAADRRAARNRATARRAA